VRYFLRTFFIYLLLILGFSFFFIDRNIEDLSGQDVESNVKFVYEAF
jgi:lipopolysaccharide export LptBFGC system permease protein LptF